MKLKIDELNSYKEELIKIDNQIKEINKSSVNSSLYEKRLDGCIQKLIELKSEINIKSKDLKKYRNFGIISTLLFLIITILSFIILPLTASNAILLFVSNSLLLPLVATVSFEKYFYTKSFLKHNTLDEVEKTIEDALNKKDLNRRKSILNNQKIEELKIKQNNIISELKKIGVDEETSSKIINEFMNLADLKEASEIKKDSSYSKIKRLQINSNE